MLTTDMDKETINRRINNALAQLPEADGMNNHLRFQSIRRSICHVSYSKNIKREGEKFC